MHINFFGRVSLAMRGRALCTSLDFVSYVIYSYTLVCVINKIIPSIAQKGKQRNIDC